MDVPNTPQSCRISLPETPHGAFPGDLAGLMGGPDHDDPTIMLENEPTGTVIEVQGTMGEAASNIVAQQNVSYGTQPSFAHYTSHPQEQATIALEPSQHKMPEVTSMPEAPYSQPPPTVEQPNMAQDNFPVPPLPPIQTSEALPNNVSEMGSVKSSGSMPSLSRAGSAALPHIASLPSLSHAGSAALSFTGGDEPADAPDAGQWPNGDAVQQPQKSLNPVPMDHPVPHFAVHQAASATHPSAFQQLPVFTPIPSEQHLPMQNASSQQLMGVASNGQSMQQPQPAPVSMIPQGSYPANQNGSMTAPPQTAHAPAHHSAVQNQAPVYSPAPHYVQATQQNGHGAPPSQQMGQAYAPMNPQQPQPAYQDGNAHGRAQSNVVTYAPGYVEPPPPQHQRAHSLHAQQVHPVYADSPHVIRVANHHVVHGSHGMYPTEEQLPRAHSRSGSHSAYNASGGHPGYNLEHNMSRGNSQTLPQYYAAPPPYSRDSYANSAASSPPPGPIERAISGVPSEASLASKVDFIQQSDSVRKLVNQCKLWTREISDMMGELESLRVEHLQAQIKELKEDVNKRDELVKGLTEERDQLSAEKEENLNQIDHVQAENAALNREAEDLKRSLASKNSIIDRLRMEYEQLLTELEQKDQIVQQLTRAHSEETEEARKQRVVSGLLTELKSSTFERTFCKVVELFYTNPMLLCVLVDKIFENALSDLQSMENYAEMVAKLQPVLPEFDDPDAPENAQNKLTFSRFLMAKCQEEFEDGCKAMDMVNQHNNDPALNKALQAAYMRSLTVIQFIGCLFKKNAVPEAIVHKCIVKMLQVELPRAQEVEAICRLFITIGPALHHVPKARSIMEAYFGQIEMFTRNHMLNPRLRLQLLDLIDLRSNNWILRGNQGRQGSQQMA